MKCPDCGAGNPDDAKICVGCNKAVEWWRVKTTGRFGKLNPDVLKALDAMPKTWRMCRPDRDQQEPKLTPAEAILKDGRRSPCTLFLDVSNRTGTEYFSPIGVLGVDYEFNETTRRMVIMPDLVSSVASSPYRTPPAIEEKMNRATQHIPAWYDGFWCKLVIDDGSEYLIERKDWDTQFIVLPDGIPNSRISDAVPLDMFENNRLEEAGRVVPDPGTKYCLFTR